MPEGTLPGNPFAGRRSRTHVVNAGFPDLTARNEDDYAGIIASLADDLPRLAALRDRLRPSMAKSPACDAQRFARYFCTALNAIS